MLPAPLAKLVDTTVATEAVRWLSPHAIRVAALGHTRFTRDLLEAMRSGDGALATAFPELAALAAPMATQVEHDAGSDRPLLDHVGTRVLGKKLLGLETRDLGLFQQRGLSATAFAQLADVWNRVQRGGLGPVVRVALLHLDIAKTASGQWQRAWTAQNIPLDIHNEAAAAILRRAERVATWPMTEALGRCAIAFVEAHGLAGQHVRGETPLAMFAPLIATLRELAVPLARDLGTDPAAAILLALEALHVIDACDTGAVREGLLDDALLARLGAVTHALAGVYNAPHADPHVAFAQIAPPPDRPTLAARLHALRAGRQASGEPAAAVDAAVAALGDQELAAFAPALATCQLWYCEAATSGLSPAGQLAVLAAAIGAARQLGVDVSRPWHAQLRPLVARLHGDTAAVRYRLRLVEAALTATPIRTLLTGGARLGPVGTVSARLAHPTELDTIVVDYSETDESVALVTLLGLYETRSQVAYHTMLKALCDLYGLRKDEFDRVANEANYLATMNAARTDKERMLDYVRPGRIVEIGPGGGVVLDLLAARFPESEIIGVDLSREVVAALAQQAKAGAKHWKVVLGAAEDLAQHVTSPVDTVVFCSILHEVYSYTEPKFQLASVQHVVAAAFATLGPGGRIVIRDGVMPPHGIRRIRLIAPDARPTLELYCEQFEGRKITYRELSPDRVEMSAPDAMEFLYTYTWGAASFPYEVRELYGVLPYDEYVARLVDWCGGEGVARVVPNALNSYLQPGYRDNLVGKIELADEHDRPVDLPDSNCLIVIEKRV